jgi:hypothetical protein
MILDATTALLRLKMALDLRRLTPASMTRTGGGSVEEIPRGFSGSRYLVHVIKDVQESFACRMSYPGFGPHIADYYSFLQLKHTP